MQTGGSADGAITYSITTNIGGAFLHFLRTALLTTVFSPNIINIVIKISNKHVIIAAKFALILSKYYLEST